MHSSLTLGSPSPPPPARQAVPLFVTSMLLPLLVVVLGVLVDRSKEPPVRLTPQQAAPAIFHAMFSQVRGQRAWGVTATRQSRCVDRGAAKHRNWRPAGSDVSGDQRKEKFAAGGGAGIVARCMCRKRAGGRLVGKATSHAAQVKRKRKAAGGVPRGLKRCSARTPSPVPRLLGSLASTQLRRRPCGPDRTARRPHGTLPLVQAAVQPHPPHSAQHTAAHTLPHGDPLVPLSV